MQRARPPQAKPSLRIRTAWALYPLRPERVTVEADATGWPAAYRYRVGERVTRLDTSEAIHVRAFHPLDDHYGLGCLGAAAGAIAIHNAAAVWAKALLDHAARPSGALVYEPGDGPALSTHQFPPLRDAHGAALAGAANESPPASQEVRLRWK